MTYDVSTGAQANRLDKGFEKFDFADAGGNARLALSTQAFDLQQEDHSLRNLGIASGLGFAAGAAGTAAGDYALMKAVEPIGRVFGAVAFGMLGGGRGAGAFLSAPPLTFLETVSPKRALIGGLVVAGLAVGGYELYQYLKS